jgi:hypothetical protein
VETLLLCNVQIDGLSSQIVYISTRLYREFRELSFLLYGEFDCHGLRIGVSGVGVKCKPGSQMRDLGHPACFSLLAMERDERRIVQTLIYDSSKNQWAMCF